MEVLEAATHGGLSFLRTRLGRQTAGEPLLLFTHGSGFNAGVWRPTLDHLRAVRPKLTAEVLALDWTGHGRSRPPAGLGVSAERYEWRTVAPRDVFELLAEQSSATAGRPLVGVGHSFGGAGLVLAELARPGTFRGLVLVEPIIRAPEAGATHPLVERTRRRRARFDVASLDDVREHFAARAYAMWDPAALAGYVERGFRPASAPGGARCFELACAPDVEASVYLGGMQSSIYERLSDVGCACTVAAGGRSATLATERRSNVQQHREIARALKGCILPVAVAAERGHSVPSGRHAARARRLPDRADCSPRAVRSPCANVRASTPVRARLQWKTLHGWPGSLRCRWITLPRKRSATMLRRR